MTSGLQWADATSSVRDRGAAVDDRDGIGGGWYDAENRYLIIGINGTNYHYCRVPEGMWASVSGMTMSEYRAELRGEYDCRRGGVPGY